MSVREHAEPGAVLLDVRNLHASYGAVEVLRGIDLRVRTGEIVALLGTNGAGKSTILRCISSLMGVDAGTIMYDGREVTDLSTEDTVSLGITQVPGGRGLLPNLSVEDNLRMGAYPIRKHRDRVKAGYDRVYETFPRLAERRKQLAGLMSGGEQQMLAIGRALMLQPKLMMIDELSLGLAPIVVQHLVQVVKRINEEGVAMILVEQSANLALSITDHAYFIEKGRIRFDGSSRELLERDDLLRSVFLAAAH